MPKSGPQDLLSSLFYMSPTSNTPDSNDQDCSQSGFRDLFLRTLYSYEDSIHTFSATESYVVAWIAPPPGI